VTVRQELAAVVQVTAPQRCGSLATVTLQTPPPPQLSQGRSQALVQQTPSRQNSPAEHCASL
jgi:hypothetical protein